MPKSEATREILVYGEKTFKITVPLTAKITYGPFSPPSGKHGYAASPEKAVGTLRVYDGSKDRIIAVFAGVRGFRDVALDYEEEVAVEQGATIWKSDKDGYKREERVSGRREWVKPALNAADDEDTPF